MSTARRQPIRSASILWGLPCRIEASIIAASRLLAAPIAWMSPVKCRLRSSIGTTWVMPPPAAPPLIPNTGPTDASRRQATGFLPITPSPWVSPTSVVVLPSPALVGERLADDRSSLEAIRAPAGADVEVVDLGLAEDRAVVRAQVAQTGPAAQQARPFELGEQLHRVAAHLLQEVQRALHPVRGPR